MRNFVVLGRIWGFLVSFDGMFDDGISGEGCGVRADDDILIETQASDFNIGEEGKKDMG